MDHKVSEFKGNPGKLPKAKLPVLVDGNDLIPDSAIIQKFIENKHNINLNSNYSDSDLAQGFAFIKMMEEYLYWFIVCERWVDDDNWPRTREHFFSNVPKLLRTPVGNMVRKGVIKQTYGHGMGRHTASERRQLGKECLSAISNFIGQKKFFLGDHISSYDASAYAFLSNTVYCDLSPSFQKDALSYSNLQEYCERIQNEL